MMRACPLVEPPKLDGTAALKGFSSASILKLIEDRGHVGFWSSDLSFNAIAASAGLKRICGLHPMSPLGYSQLIEMIHPEDRALHERFRELLQSGQPIERELRIIRPDRTIRWVLHKVEVILGPDSVPTRAVGIFFDITAQRAAQKTVELEQSRYRTLVEAVSAVAWTSNLTGDQPVETQSWCRITGQTETELKGKGWLEAVHPEDRERVWQAWQSAVGQKAVYKIAFRVRSPEGGYSWMESRATPILNLDGSIQEWIGLCLDVSGGRQAESDVVDHASAPPLTGAQVRAARGMLNWSVEDLARASGISTSTIRRFESGTAEAQVRQDNLQAIRGALDEAGILCTYRNGRPGVHLK